MEDSKYPYKVLFVEDEKITRDNYTQYLSGIFQEVFEAEDGNIAYKLYKEKKPDILIVDINIPKLNGLDLLKKIREDDFTTKAIVLTAHENVELLQQAVSLKLTKYLVKPVSRKALKEAIDLVISEISNYKVISSKNINLSGDYFWSFETQTLSNNINDIYLTNKERRVLSYLMKNPNKQCSSDEIIYDVWDGYSEGNLNSLKTTIKTLRKKLPKDIIKNIFGVGYKIEL